MSASEEKKQIEEGTDVKKGKVQDSIGSQGFVNKPGQQVSAMDVLNESSQNSMNLGQPNNVQQPSQDNSLNSTNYHSFDSRLNISLQTLLQISRDPNNSRDMIVQAIQQYHTNFYRFQEKIEPPPHQNQVLNELSISSKNQNSFQKKEDVPVLEAGNSQNPPKVDKVQNPPKVNGGKVMNPQENLRQQWNKLSEQQKFKIFMQQRAQNQMLSKNYISLQKDLATLYTKYKPKK